MSADDDQNLQLDLTQGIDEVPQANSLPVMVRLLEALARGTAEVDALAEHLGVEPRTVHYYLDLGSWLGFVSCDAGEYALTSEGTGFVESHSARGRIFARAVFARPLAQAVNQLKRQAAEADRELTTRQAAEQAIMRLTELSESTARRRASALTRLLEAAWRPSHYDWETGQELATYKHRALEFAGESFLTAMAVRELGVFAHVEVGLPRQVWRFACGQAAELSPKRWRRASYDLKGGGRWFGAVPVTEETVEIARRGGRDLRRLLVVCAPYVACMAALLTLREPIAQNPVRLTRDMYGTRLWFHAVELGEPAAAVSEVFRRMGLEIAHSPPTPSEPASDAACGSKQLVEILEAAEMVRERDTVLDLARGVAREWRDGSADNPSVYERLEPLRRQLREILRDW